MGGVKEFFSRYLSLVDDHEAFLASLERPLPVCFWVNPVKTTEAPLLAHLRQLGVQPVPLGWYPTAFRVDTWPRPGATLPFLAGWYYLQEEIALTAVAALDPQPGERVVDLCASPGGKTAQIALRVGPTGLVVANESQLARLSGLRATVDRLGLLNVVVTWGDGRTLALPQGVWDRVLVDAPCTGEGTVRKPDQRWRPAPLAFRKALYALQRRLLERALALAKPGGVVVYSTCTFDPEENEAVLDAVLGEAAFVEPFCLPGLSARPGITSWQGRSFRADVVHAQRFWPHLNDTGGFFVARLRRTAAPVDQRSTRVPAVRVPAFVPATGAAVASLMARFGIAEQAFAEVAFWQRGGRVVWMAHRHVQPEWAVAVEGLGTPLAQHTPHGIKPKTFALQYLAPHIRSAAVELPDAEACRRFVSGQSQNLPAQDVAPGYVLVRYGPFALGCGLYSRGQLHSQMPAALRGEYALPSG
ncbi:MAG: hypothetical protein NZ869_11080 [Thermoanaerobaculum sp.]|nr:hypothetical protein [Thermoanaerobaculum sp.]MDW7967644.1 hypothetical protein [Thermoanaerobaculum sp.]